MVEYSSQIIHQQLQLLHTKRVGIVSEEVNKFNTDKRQSLEVMTRYPNPDGNIPYYVSVVKRKENLGTIRRIFGKLIPSVLYDTLIDVVLAPLASQPRTVRVHNLEYASLGKSIETKWLL